MGNLPELWKRMLHVHIEVPCLRAESEHYAESRQETISWVSARTAPTVLSADPENLKRLPLSDAIQQELNEKGVAVIPLKAEEVSKEKLDLKVCQQYALDEYAENIVLLDTGYAKIMTPYFPLEKLRKVPGLENARYADPYAGGKGNSIRYLSVAERDNLMRVVGIDNLLCGGEKSGLFVGHTEAISTGTLAGYNSVRYLKGNSAA